MPAEAPSQQQTAEQAVNSVAENSRQNRIDAQIQRNADARLTRQQERLAQVLNGKTPEQGLRTLAYAEGEGLRSSNNKDWTDAKIAAKVWLEPLQDAANQELPEGFLGTAY